MRGNKFFLTIFLLMAAAAPFASADEGRWTGEFESGAVFSGANNVRIPNRGGTLFSLSRDLNIPGRPYLRLRLTYALGRRHEISALFAPLTLKASGRLAAPVFFQNTLFPAGSDVAGTYVFNSYRLTWRYRLVFRPKLSLWFGFTAKIRDAEIALRGSGLSVSKSNVGFVPLLHFRLAWDIRPRLALLLDADAAAAKQGRAEDVLVALAWKASRKLQLRIGYRFVEGGADVDEVYNFAFISYVSAALIFRF